MATTMALLLCAHAQRTKKRNTNFAWISVSKSLTLSVLWRKGGQALNILDRIHIMNNNVS
jgi:hypothetical protein